MNLLTKQKRIHMSGVMCQVSCDICQVSRCQVSHLPCHLLHVTNAFDTEVQTPVQPPVKQINRHAKLLRVTITRQSMSIYFQDQVDISVIGGQFILIMDVLVVINYLKTLIGYFKSSLQLQHSNFFNLNNYVMLNYFVF